MQRERWLSVPTSPDPEPAASVLMMELESVRETLGPDWRP